MKKISFFLLAFIMNNTLIAQKFSVKWSENFKITTGALTNNLYVKSFPTTEGNIISLFNIVRTSGMNNDYTVMMFNNKLDVVGQLELDYPKDAKEGLVDVVKLKGNCYLVEYRYTSKVDVDIVVTKLNTNTLKKEAEKKIASIDDSDSKPKMYGIGIGTMYGFDMGINYSADSSKLLLTYEPDQKNKDTKKMQAVVLSQDLEKIAVTNHEWQEAYKKIDIFNTQVDNNGKAYLFYNVYEKSFDKEYKRSDGDKIPAYTSSLMTLDNGSKAFYSFSGDGKFLHDIGIGYDEKKSPILIGMYKEKYNGRITGVFKTPAIGSTTVVSNLAFTPFPAELLAQFDADNQAKSSGNKQGLDNEFYTGYTISVNDGVNHMITEYFDISVRGGGEFTKFIKGNFLVTTFLTNGKVQFQRLPRYQSTMNVVSSTNLTSRNSFTPDYFGNNLFMFYNDNEDNATKDINEKPAKFDNERNSVLLAAIMNHDGKLISRKIVYSNRDLDGYVTNLRFAKIKDDTYIVFAIKAGNLKHQTIAGLLTIK